ncbi:MAG TPA: hypothetical protein VKV18_10205 [Chthonomonas sp.]|nr:hypothetical protein [Chthonomonas sp.]
MFGGYGFDLVLLPEALAYAKSRCVDRKWLYVGKIQEFIGFTLEEREHGDNESGFSG